MLEAGKAKKDRKNPNDPARFIGKMAVTKEGEAADIRQYLDEDKIAEEARYDGLYAVCTDLLDDEVGDILKVSEGQMADRGMLPDHENRFFRKAGLLTG